MNTITVSWCVHGHALVILPCHSGSHRVSYTFVSGPSDPYWKVSRTLATDEAKKGPMALL